jgi:two-component system response regulator AtoC
MSRNIYIIEDEYLVRWTLEKELTKEGYIVETFESGEKGLKRMQAELPDVILLDLGLPQMDGLEVLRKVKEMNNVQVEIIIITAKEDIRTAVRAIKLGAYDYVTKPLDLDNLKQLIRNSIETMCLKKEVYEIRKFQKKIYGVENIIGESKEMQKVFSMARKIAKSKATTVLLSGESGTGKELIAKFIHYQSERCNMPFTEINCSAVPDTLLETELMGYEKGAFTDAKKRKPGLLEQCNGGTLFLDEIGDMKLDLQTKVLSLIENKRFRRVGGIKDMETDIRIIAATNRDLWSAVKDGYFREDLYYRLKVFPITLPPLRERGGDIPLLIKYFIDYFNKEFKKNIKGISKESQRYLKSYRTLLKER